jgi:hypothetical protein
LTTSEACEAPILNIRSIFRHKSQIRASNSFYSSYHEEKIFYISHREQFDQFEAYFVPEFQKSEA